LTSNVSPDAVVVIPGIMGSTLVDTTTGQQIWGLRPGWYARAWASRKIMRALMLTDDERAGRVGRVKATGLLECPAFSPVLAGLEPYTKLVNRIRATVVSPEAVLNFGYDWRLPVEHNACLLAIAAAKHLEKWRAQLEKWRADPEHEVARLTHLDDRPAQLVLVAHSMGGLLCRALPRIIGTTDDIRATVTLGTPFDGAAKAAVLLNSGRGPVPLPRRRLQELAATLPGVHDLLPMYRCVDDGDHVRRLTPADVADLGGDWKLAEAAQDSHTRLAPLRLIRHRAVIGTKQRTVQSLELRDGVVRELHHSFLVGTDGELARHPDGLLWRVPGDGDGTVPLNSAEPFGVEPFPLPQQHGQLAQTEEAINFVCWVINSRGDPFAPRLGAGEDTGDIGLDLPDVVTPGAGWAATVTGVTASETIGLVVEVQDVQTGLRVDRPPLERRDGQIQATVRLPEPGLFRIIVSGGPTTPVSQLVMAEAPGDDE
jgi:pimeloyl-ACP methyl ester carboxylesterase